MFTLTLLQEVYFNYFVEYIVPVEKATATIWSTAFIERFSFCFDSLITSKPTSDFILKFIETDF